MYVCVIIKGLLLSLSIGYRAECKTQDFQVSSIPKSFGANCILKSSYCSFPTMSRCAQTNKQIMVIVYKNLMSSRNWSDHVLHPPPPSSIKHMLKKFKRLTSDHTDDSSVLPILAVAPGQVRSGKFFSSPEYLRHYSKQNCIKNVYLLNICISESQNSVIQFTQLKVHAPQLGSSLWKLFFTCQF